MSPILGIYASQISGHLWAPTGAYDSIATANGTGSSGTITFSSIPSTYTHLQLRMINKGSAAGTFPAGMQLIFNSDTTATNYYQHNIRGDGASAFASANNSNSGYSWAGAGSTTANVYAVGILDLLDYKDTNKYKTARTLTGADYNGSGMVTFASMLWKNTAAITSITCISDPTYTGNWTTATQFALYGIKAGA